MHLLKGKRQRLWSAGHGWYWGPHRQRGFGGEGSSAAKVRWCRTVGRNTSRGQVHLGHFMMLSQRELAILVLEGVYVDRSIRRLCGNELVQRVPGYALYVMVVLGDLPYDTS